MRKWLGVAIALVGLSVIAVDVEAARLGGGRSIGKQREAIGQQHTAPSAPAQQPHQAQNPAQQPRQATPQPSGMSRWLGPLAGLAIGAGLAALFFNNGMGGALMGILLLAAIVFGVMMLGRMFRGARPAQQPLRYAGATPDGRSEPVVSPSYGSAAPNSVAATTVGGGSTPATRFPPDFNAEEFARHAKANFVKLQDAHDRKDLAAIRDFLTPEMTREIEAEIRTAGNEPQKTDVVTVDADVLDLVRENGSYVVSVKFSGLIREAASAPPQPFSEIWHLEKPVDGRTGWQLAGIQQA